MMVRVVLPCELIGKAGGLLHKRRFKPPLFQMCRNPLIHGLKKAYVFYRIALLGIAQRAGYPVRAGNRLVQYLTEQCLHKPSVTYEIGRASCRERVKMRAGRGSRT